MDVLGPLKGAWILTGSCINEVSRPAWVTTHKSASSSPTPASLLPLTYPVLLRPHTAGVEGVGLDLR